MSSHDPCLLYTHTLLITPAAVKAKRLIHNQQHLLLEDLVRGEDAETGPGRRMLTAVVFMTHHTHVSNVFVCTVPCM